MELPCEAVALGTRGGQLRAESGQFRSDGLTAPGGGRNRRSVVGGNGGFLSQQLQPHPGLPGSGFGLRQLLAADGAGAEQAVGGGTVKGGRGETADLQQDSLLVGGERIIQSLRGGGFSVGGGLGRVPGLV